MPYICCMTAYNTMNFKKEALAAGMDAVMIKPIFKEQLRELLLKSGFDLA